MRREIKEEYLQNLYTKDDMVRCGTSDCMGCSHCCEEMGETIVLDPYDVWQFEIGLARNFGGLLQDTLELSVYEGIIMPHIKTKEGTNRCVYLREDGKCSVHGMRTGLCRLFPLARIYDEDGMHYILQKEDCPREPKVKMKIEKWLGLPELSKYEAYIQEWHTITVNLREALAECDDATARAVNTKFLEIFYLEQYEDSDFYEQFYKRLHRWQSLS
ncbi:MAG: YkgJ family cysteine cluster protein [Lachnospiraceae bacterium]|nr:YkgJ family cysteine cluster protein [Lachnospiraceae bacterium]